jgi:DNA sulfur modification protein DndD
MGSPSYFKLVRSIFTEDDGSKVTSMGEEARLLKKDGDDWEELPDTKFQSLLRRYFRYEMRDFFFIDADKAVEFVGGPENKHDPALMRQTTTAAMRAMLGLEAMLQAAQRLEERATEFSRQAGKLSAAVESQSLANELTTKIASQEQERERLQELSTEADEARVKALDANERFMHQIRLHDETMARRKEMDSLDKALEETKLKKFECSFALSERLMSKELATILFLPTLQAAKQQLSSEETATGVSAQEISMIKTVLNRGTCICGSDLHSHSESKRNLETTLEKVHDSEGELSQVIMSTLLDLENVARDGGWVRSAERARKVWADVISESAELDEKRELLRDEFEKQTAGISGLAERKKQVEDLQRRAAELEEKRRRQQHIVEQLHLEVRSLDARISAATKAETANRAQRNSATVARDLAAIIGVAYERIEKDQVQDVARTMDSIFKNVIGATDSTLFEAVGVRPFVDGSRTQYEPYAIQGGRDKELSLANGASRHTIGVAFILALAEQTRSKVPLVADSLLHNMSGEVKKRLVDYISRGDRIGQPILFGTRDDLRSPVDQIIKERAGRTYTLTAQAHAGGDVKRATPSANSRAVVVCTCHIDEFCDVCERVRDAESGLKKRVLSAGVA